MTGRTRLIGSNIVSSRLHTVFTSTHCNKINLVNSDKSSPATLYDGVRKTISHPHFCQGLRETIVRWDPRRVGLDVTEELEHLRHEGVVVRKRFRPPEGQIRFGEIKVIRLWVGSPDIGDVP